MMENQIGKVIKSYRLDGLIGTGGFGAVYKAMQSIVDREVAIKIIWPAFANHPNFIRRFEAEAQLVAGLEHPYIVPLYDYWRDPEGAYIVMRYLRGGALRDKMTDEQWALPDVNRLVNQICSALALAHRSGVVHRDIKPENILLDEEGNAYLADFGIAEIVGSAQENGNEFFAGMGSPAYAPPEQISGGLTSSQSDIYSLSVIIYELITGEHPFPELEDLSITELNEMRAKTNLPSIMDKRTAVSRVFNDVIQKASALDPKDRFADAMSFARAFHDASGNSGRVYSATRVRDANEVIPNPYKGLRAFQETDAANFFGRSALVNRLINRLKEDGPYSRFLAVVGPSGSGKSSVVRAGLIPELRNGAVPGATNWYYDQVIPGEQAFSEIENAIISLATEPPEYLHERLMADESGMLEAFNDVLPDDDDPEFLLFIDQFEEVFTLSEDAAQTSHFLQSLYTAVTDPRSRMRIIITIRADFYDRPLLQPRLSDMVRERTEVVVPLSPTELERVIMEPARRSGVMIDHGLVASIVAEVKEQPGSLPLLQYTLSELFERRDGSVITPDIYRDLGGVRGALANRAQEIIDSLTQEETRAVRQLFLRLITLGEGTEDTRRRALITEITSIRDDEDFADSESIMRRVVNILGDARLVTFDRDPVTRSPTVEVTHEAIIREWETLRNWLDESRTDVRMQRTLSNLANEWDSNHRDQSFLMRGVRLDSYEKWVEDSNLALTRTEKDYLESSVRTRQEREVYEAERVARERLLEQRALNRTRVLAVVLSVATLGALALSAYAFFLSNQAQLFSAESQSIAWEASARQALSEDEGDLAVLLALQAVNMNEPPSQSISTLAQVAYAQGTRRLFTGHDAWVQDVAFSPDASLIASASTDATVKIWDADTGEIIHDLTAHGGDVESVTFSPDGQYVVSTATDFLAILWDVETGAEVRRFSTTPSIMRDAAFTPDGLLLMTVSNDGLVILWDVETGAEIRRFDGHGVATVLTVAVHPDLPIALSGGRDGSVFMWNLETGEGTALTGHSSQVNDIEFSPSGTFAITASGDGVIMYRDMLSEDDPREFSGSFEEVRDIEISADEQFVYAASISGEIQVFDIENGILVDRLTGHSDSALGLAISQDGQYLVSGAKDAAIRIWNVGLPGAEQFYSAHTGRVQDIAYSNDGNLIYSASVDGTIQVWNRETQSIQRSYEGSFEALFAIDVASDDSFVVIGSRSLVFVVNLTTGEIQQTLNAHTARINDIVIFADDTRALTAGLDDLIILWNLETGEEIRRFIGHESAVNGITLVSGDSEFVSASADNTIRRWNIETGEELNVYRGHSEIVSAVASSPEGTQFVSGGRDGLAIVWDVETGSEIRSIVVGVPAIWSVDFNENGNRVAISAEQGVILVHDINENSEVERFDIGDSNVFAVEFAPDGRSLASGQDDASVIIWRMYEVDGLIEWINENRYIRTWNCIEVEQYRLPEDIECSSQ